MHLIEHMNKEILYVEMECKAVWGVNHTKYLSVFLP